MVLQGATSPTGEVGGVNSLQVGNGTSVSSIDSIVTQGSIQSSDSETDLAIEGEGYFVISDGQHNYFTRAGSFQWDSDGSLVMPSNGMKVQGKIADANGVVNDGSTVSDIVVSFGMVDEAKETSEVGFVGNLDSSSDPVGNILETDRVYAKEQSGSTTDMNGLYAKGNTDLQVTGLSDNSTTVTVTWFRFQWR